MSEDVNEYFNKHLLSKNIDCEIKPIKYEKLIFDLDHMNLVGVEIVKLSKGDRTIEFSTSEFWDILYDNAKDVSIEPNNLGLLG
jgi:hypothetical protein